jgi:hypothetical protein
MKLLFAVFVSAFALAAQDPQANPPAEKPAPKATPKAAAKAAPKALAPPKVKNASKPQPIPAEAVLGAEGDYHYTDPQGKKWIYRKTPFGVSRMEDTPQLASTKTAAAVAAAAYIKATEDGDIVRFERKGPFGLWKWEKKKSELDEGEKAALANSQNKDKTASKQD